MYDGLSAKQRSLHDFISRADIGAASFASALCGEIAGTLGAECAVIAPGGAVAACSGHYNERRIGVSTDMKLYKGTTLTAVKETGAFSEEDIMYLKFVSVILAVFLRMNESGEHERGKQKQKSAEDAVAALTYSELDAVLHIVRTLGQKSEGMLTSSKVAADIGITRSVISGALRKLESAGIIESRSLGMKGTYIKVLNEALFEVAGRY